MLVLEPVVVGGGEIAESVVAIVSELTGYPPELLDLDLDLEADLGVDTVKQAEVFAAVRAKFGVARDDTLQLRDFPTLASVIGWVVSKMPAAPVVEPEPQPLEVLAPTPEPVVEQQPLPAPEQVVVGGGEIAESVVAIVSELTGYPPELLDLDLDLEADLGVDTVKQAEVFAAVRAKFGVARDDTLQLRDFPTLSSVIGWVASKMPAAPVVEPEPQPLEVLAPTPEPVVEQQPLPAPEPVVVGGGEIAESVVAIVSELTGYPPELLDLDLDLEADLGVDTVKQAEVFAAVRAKFGVARDDTLQLRDFPTLSSVIGWVASKMPAAPVVEPEPQPVVEQQPQPEPKPVAAQPHDDVRFPRRVPIPVLRPPVERCAESGVVLDKAARVIVMLDDGGVGDRLVAQLTDLGVTSLTLAPGVDSTTLAATLARWHADGPIDGLYWLAALDDEGPVDDLDLAGWREALRRRVKNLYATVRANYGSAAFLVSATRLGGYLGYTDAGATAPLGGAVSGFTKAYHREQPGTLVKVVDVPLGFDPDRLAELLVAETRHDAGCVEVGHVDDGTRWTVALSEEPFGGERVGMRLGKDTVVAVTGAAGSIVSSIVADLAAASGGTFHLLDLTPAPDPTDPDLRRFAVDKDGLKTDLAARLKAAGQRPTPVLIERELARLERSAAALAAMDAVTAAGGTAHYHCVDLTDPAAMAAAVQAIRATSGHVDVLLHAAGLEISHTLPDKEPAEYDLVFDVKADGWFNLLHAASDLPIGAVVAFSSVAGRFGNSGQTDYSAANDLLCKLVSNLRRTRPTVRGIVIDWTAWAGIGMATRGSIPKIMELAGVEMLDPQVGVPWIRRELTEVGRSGEVVVAGRLGALAAPSQLPGGFATSVVADAGPMIGTVELTDDGLIVRTTLDPVRQPFLDDHRLDGTAMLPGVMGMEAFAEVGRLLAPPGWHVVDVEDVDFLAPVKFYRDEPRELTIRATVVRDHTDLAVRCALEAQRTLVGASEPKRITHFTGSVTLSRTKKPAEHADAISEPRAQVGHDRVYQLYFHGPAYQVVDATWRDHVANVARFAPGLPPNHVSGGTTVTLPRLAELCLQTAGLLEAAEYGRLALPQHVDCLDLVTDPPDGPLYATATFSGDGFDCAVQDARGVVVLAIYGYRTVAVPATVPDDIRRGLASSGTPEMSRA